MGGHLLMATLVPEKSLKHSIADNGNFSQWGCHLEEGTSVAKSVEDSW